MMQFIANLKIVHKLLLMLLFPMLGLMYLSSNQLLEKYHLTQDMDKLEHTIELSVNFSRLLHQVQRERSFGGLFLQNPDSKWATMFSQEMAATDKLMAVIHDFLKTLDNNLYTATFRAKLENVLTLLENLKALREEVVNKRLDEPLAIQRYTEISQPLLVFIIQVVEIIVNRDVLKMELAYVNVLVAKEKAALERSLMAKIFFQKRVEAAQIRKLTELITEGQSFLDRNEQVLFTDSQTTFFKATMVGEFIDETQRMREIVYDPDSNGQLKQTVDPEYWHKMQTGRIELLKAMADKCAQDLLEVAVTIRQVTYQQLLLTMSSTLLIIALALFLVMVVLTGVNTRLNSAVQIADAIAQGNLENVVVAATRDETGQLLRALGRMQTQLRERLAKDQRIAAEALRLNRALDYATTCILITDNQYQIIYLNEAAQRLFTTEGDKFRIELPQFEATQMVGTKVDFFHKNPAVQHQIFNQLSGSRRARVMIGGITLEHILTPVTNINGERLGLVVEFNNCSLEVAITEEINTVIQAAAQGNFQQRIDLEHKTGFFKLFSESINQILEINQGFIEEVMRIFAALSQGDLTKMIENNYTGTFEQLKNDANTTVRQLTKIITIIKQTADSVSTGAEDLSQSNVSLNLRTEQQAASLEETAASMEQITSTVQQNADNAKQANLLASSARESAETGGVVVGSTIQAITEIHRSSQKITDIISVIDGIAFQTNLLALNAAVEAARAGEQGRGFAVVATEVRNLAQRSAAAAKEIKGLIHDSVTKVEEGTKLANRSGETLKEIVSAVQKVSDIIAKIAFASQEQSVGIQQVNRAIAQMDQMTQQNASLVQQAASAGQAMKEQAQSLKQQVAFFKS